MRIRDKIYNGVILRLEILNKNKEVVKKIIATETDKPINTLSNYGKHQILSGYQLEILQLITTITQKDYCYPGFIYQQYYVG